MEYLNFAFDSQTYIIVSFFLELVRNNLFGFVREMNIKEGIQRDICNCFWIIL